jgi:hypothetical protein
MPVPPLGNLAVQLQCERRGIALIRRLGGLPRGFEFVQSPAGLLRIHPGRHFG